MVTFYVQVLKLVDTDTLKLWFNESDIWPHLINYVTIECAADSGYGETQKSSENLFACVELCLFYDKGEIFDWMEQGKSFMWLRLLI